MLFDLGFGHFWLLFCDCLQFGSILVVLLIVFLDVLGTTYCVVLVILCLLEIRFSIITCIAGTTIVGSFSLVLFGCYLLGLLIVFLI